MRILIAWTLILAVGVAWGAPAATPPAAGAALAGEVLEVKDVDAYTYLRLKTADGEIWAAVNKAPVTKGAKVTIESPATMTNFTSKTLNKTFDKIVFGTLGGTATAAGKTTPVATGGVASIRGSTPPPADVADVKVAKASGPQARTVAEIVGTRNDLKGKSVVVRGKVVKFTPEVMGKNWVHLRDGSGSEADGTNDVLVTTKDETKVGDVVVARGVVRTDIDLGSGYAYKVLVEEAKLEK